VFDVGIVEKVHDFLFAAGLVVDGQHNKESGLCVLKGEWIRAPDIRDH
jgi:hypothetical protein